MFWTVFLSKRVIGSYVGNRQDAHEALALAAQGKVKTLYKTLPASELPGVYDQMHAGKLTGRIVLDVSGCLQPIQRYGLISFPCAPDGQVLSGSWTANLV